MTENEVIKVFKEPTKHIKNFLVDGEETICYSTDMVKAFEMAMKALEEIQAYRAIGTVEELKAMKEAPMTEDELKEFEMLSDIVEQLQQLEEYKLIGTIEQVRVAVERMKPYKPKEYEDRYYACKCDNILLPKWRKYPTELMPKSKGLPHCMACGQKLDWN